MLTKYTNGQQKTRLLLVSRRPRLRTCLPRERTVCKQSPVWRYVFTFATHNPGSLRSSDLPGIDDHGTGLIRLLNEWMKKNLPWKKKRLLPLIRPIHSACLSCDSSKTILQTDEVGVKFPISPTTRKFSVTVVAIAEQ
jgi:hypothetical protein